MLRFLKVFFIALSFQTLVQPLWACQISPPLVLEDVKYADVVVVGRVSNYRMQQGMRARFDVHVTETLKGKASTKLLIFWHNWTFGSPKKLEPGPFLIALRKPNASDLSFEESKDASLASRKSDAMVILQDICAPAFLFPAASQTAIDVRAILNGEPVPQRPKSYGFLIDKARQDTERQARLAVTDAVRGTKQVELKEQQVMTSTVRESKTATVGQERPRMTIWFLAIITPIIGCIGVLWYRNRNRQNDV